MKILYPVVIFLLFLIIVQNSSAGSQVYPVVAHLNVRSQPSIQSRIISRLTNGKWVQVRKTHGDWTEVSLNSGDTGFVFNKLVSDLWIKIWKKERKLLLMSGSALLKTYPVGLGFNPNDDKIKRGDGSSPIGRFFVCEMLDNPVPAKKYGARSIRISYPGIEDARRGLKDKFISKSEYLKIVKQIDKAQMPLQNTLLGGSIRIHGGGAGSDWTLGCIAMNDDDIIELYSKLPSRNTLVEIYQGEAEDRKINKKKYLTGSRQPFNKNGHSSDGQNYQVGTSFNCNRRGFP
ncbi:MAG: L,D-transpeptidase family protein [Desulfobacteraceae bacterium]|nr:L,D-transpeptidase family protein [Desulfobacteraceae bacterium]